MFYSLILPGTSKQGVLRCWHFCRVLLYALVLWVFAVMLLLPESLYADLALASILHWALWLTVS